MIDVKKAKSIIESKYPDRKVDRIAVYKNGYLVAAPRKSVDGPDHSDPYFLVDSNGSISGFSPIMDFKGYGKAFSQNLVYQS